MRVLVTGAAGFIGYHLSRRLLADGHTVTGIDNLNPYYSVQLKRDRLAELRGMADFRFHRMDVADRRGMRRLFGGAGFDRVVHLAAQAGVRYSLVNPYAYVESNITGFLNVLEGCRSRGIPHLLYASSSSVYGANAKLPFAASDRCDEPLSLYAATKRADELMAHSYSHLFGVPTTGLRFFTVYGPWGRPDMALFLFTRAILEGRAIEVFNGGDMRRDFTYIDDIVEGVVRLMDRMPSGCQLHGQEGGQAGCRAAAAIYNLGNSEPVTLDQFIASIEEALGRTAVRRSLGMQPGDVRESSADMAHTESAIGAGLHTPIDEGVRRFVRWYRDYYLGRPARKHA
jgi:UDP-glucuronate 4-epimerase